MLVEVIKSAIFGLVEGISEWLPISSTGHMLLLDQIMALNVSKDFWEMFLYVIQLGAILAVCTQFFSRLNIFSPRLKADGRKNMLLLWLKIIVACLPAAVVGIPLNDLIDTHLSGPVVIASTLIIYGFAFIVIELLRKRGILKVSSTASESSVPELAQAKHLKTPVGQLLDKEQESVENLPFSKALGIGVFQVLAIIPGTSRSGATILGGLLLGCSRSVAAEFSFLLALPIMIGISCLRLLKFFLKGNVFSSSELVILLSGSLVAFVVSLLVIRFLLSYVRKHDFTAFGLYRIALGMLVLFCFFVI